MLTINSERLVWWPVTVKWAADGGETVRETFDVRFRLLEGEANREALAQGDEAFMAAVVADWRDVADADGAAIPCDAQTRARFAGIPAVTVAIGEAYGEALRGGARRRD